MTTNTYLPNIPINFERNGYQNLAKSQQISPVNGLKKRLLQINELQANTSNLMLQTGKISRSNRSTTRFQIEEIRPESIAKNHLLQKKQYAEFLNRMGKDQKMSNEEAFRILGIPDLRQQFEQEQKNDAEDSDLEQFWQPIPKMRETQVKFANWAKDQSENPRQFLEETAKELYADFEFTQKNTKMFSDPNIPIHINSTPVIKCYDALNELQEKGKLFFKLPLKDILEQDKKHFEKIMNKLKRSHQIEQRNLKTQLKNNYLKLINDKLHKIQDSLAFEFGEILMQVEKKDLLIQQLQDQISHYQIMLTNQEQHLSEVVRHQTLIEIEHLSQKLEEQGRKIERNHTLYQARLDYDTKATMTQKANYLTKKDPLLNKQFKMYNSYIWLELKEKEKIAAMQILEEFADLLNEKEYFCKVKELDLGNYQYILEDYQKQEIIKDAKIEELKEQIEHLQKDLSFEKKSHQSKIDNIVNHYKSIINDLNSNYIDLREFVKLEIEAREMIQEKLTIINLDFKTEIRKLRLILKTPRLYQQYLKDMGINANPFVTQMPVVQQLDNQKKPKSRPPKRLSQKLNKISLGMMKMRFLSKDKTGSLDMLSPPQSGRIQYSSQSQFL
ncbi:UNKNOWN [Stylonychia lemnae]|uniref:Uncharacterized protein n=1 Tax=Stylonychia lemnae TaxID=5949 RepID=A0A078BD51_STYLE|nr:UNKNOWN [Stylonychia lemnae]|eukprot:CDW91142.1 UNKNOWN [Stylonychia lemnae]